MSTGYRGAVAEDVLWNIRCIDEQLQRLSFPSARQFAPLALRLRQLRLFVTPAELGVLTKTTRLTSLSPFHILHFGARRGLFLLPHPHLSSPSVFVSLARPLVIFVARLGEGICCVCATQPHQDMFMCRCLVRSLRRYVARFAHSAWGCIAGLWLRNDRKGQPWKRNRLFRQRLECSVLWVVFQRGIFFELS